MEKVSFKTEDGVTIIGDFYPAERSQAVLLLHMMPATKESWREFATKEQDAGWNVLAIDLRGHGESVNQNGKTLNYQRFTDEEHQASMKDIEASTRFLKEKDLRTSAIVGASIGANLALWYQSEHPEIAKTVLLSAGFNYRGIETESLASKLKSSQGVYFVGGNKDIRGIGQDAGEIAQALHNTSPIQNKKFDILETPEHGTDMFPADSQLVGRLVTWLAE